MMKTTRERQNRTRSRDSPTERRCPFTKRPFNIGNEVMIEGDVVAEDQSIP